MGDVLSVWAAYQTCLMRACVPRLLSGMYQLFHLCLIKHVFNRLAPHFNISLFGHQTLFDGVWSPNIFRFFQALDQIKPILLELFRLLYLRWCDLLKEEI